MTQTKRAAKPHKITIRVSDERYQSITGAAADAGLTRTAFFESLVLEGAGVQPFYNDDDRRIIALMLENMRRIGINLNQVARSLNSGKHVHPEEISIQLKNVAKIQGMVQIELRRAATRAGQERRGEAT